MMYTYLKTAHKKDQHGFSLIEALVAISILLIAIVGPMTVASRSLQASLFAKEQAVAFYLAQEGIEHIIDFRDTYALTGGSVAWEWTNLAALDHCRIDDGDGGDFGCNFDHVDNIQINCVSAGNDACRFYRHTAPFASRYRPVATNGVETPFTRVVTVEEVQAGAEVIVTSTVSWPVNAFLGVEQEVKIQSSIFNIYE